jgi:hypothetical protein
MHRTPATDRAISEKNMILPQSLAIAHANNAASRGFMSGCAPAATDCRIKSWYPAPMESLPETASYIDPLWLRAFPRWSVVARKSLFPNSSRQRIRE